jgi:hypothetical protein
MIYLQILMASFIFVCLILIVMLFKNRSLKKEIKVLKEMLKVKETSITNVETTDVAVKDVIENFSTHDEVMELVEAGESRESISEKLGIPANKIELIIKFDKIKKEKHL